MESLPWPPTEELIDALSDDDLKLLDSVVRSAVAKRFRWAGTSKKARRANTEAARQAAAALPDDKRKAQTAAATAARQAKREAAKRSSQGG